MKSRTSCITCITAMTLFAALATPARLAAQHHHYKLIDLGTFGGPQSYVNTFLPQNPVLNNRGTVAGWADTSTPDPFPAFCFNPDCFVSHTFQWQNGVMTDLGVLPGGASSASNWISASELIAGLSENGEIDPLISGFPELRAVLWQNGEITDLGTLEGGNESVANAVNSRGQVVGLALNTIQDANSMVGLGFQTRAFLWQNGIMQDLGTLGGPDAMALRVNERGQIVGWSYTSTTPCPTQAFACTGNGLALTTGTFLWQNGKMVDLGSLGGVCTLASGLNNRGQVVGLSDLVGDLTFRPFLWDRGVLTDLGTFGGSGNANAISEAGDVTGWSDTRNEPASPLEVGPLHAFLWKNGTMSDLGTVDGDSCSFGFSINSKDQIVGSSAATCIFTTPRAFLWENGGPMIDLNTLVPPGSALYLTVPETINDRGEIAGVGALPNGDQHAFLLIPCGEGDEGCGGGSSTGVSQNSPPPASQRSTTATPANPALSGRGMLDRLRSRWGQRYRIPGSGAGPTN